MSKKQEVAEAFEIPTKDLKAIVYYSDRSYSNVTVFGAKKVHNHFANTDSPFKPEVLAHKKFSDMTEVPGDGHLVDATEYGYESGKVLLVSGRPPAGG